MFLIQDYQSQINCRSKNSASRSDYNLSLTGPDIVPLFVSLLICKPAVKYCNTVSESSLYPVDRLRRKRDLRNHVYDASAFCNDLFCTIQINFGLAASGNTKQQICSRILLINAVKDLFYCRFLFIAKIIFFCKLALRHILISYYRNLVI